MAPEFCIAARWLGEHFGILEWTEPLGVFGCGRFGFLGFGSGDSQKTQYLVFCWRGGGPSMKDLTIEGSMLIRVPHFLKSTWWGI